MYLHMHTRPTTHTCRDIQTQKGKAHIHIYSSTCTQNQNSVVVVGGDMVSLFLSLSLTPPAPTHKSTDRNAESPEKSWGSSCVS